MNYQNFDNTNNNTNNNIQMVNNNTFTNSNHLITNNNTTATTTTTNNMINTNNYYPDNIKYNHVIPPLPQQTHSQNIILPPPGLFNYNTNPNNMTNNNNKNNNTSISNLNLNIHQKQESQNANGGVTSILDYDINLITDYIVKSSMIAFGLENFINNSTNNNNEWLNDKIKTVLLATRLPSVTIFLGLDYLFKYLDKLSNNFYSIGGNSMSIIYGNLMIAFILANKFNDDKTFTNKSWSIATNLELIEINNLEKKWLEKFNWKFYDDKFISYDDFAYSFEIFSQERKQQLLLNDGTYTNSIKSPELFVDSSSLVSSPIETSFNFSNNKINNNNFANNNNNCYASSPIGSYDFEFNNNSKKNNFNYDFYNFNNIGNSNNHQSNSLIIDYNNNNNNDATIAAATTATAINNLLPNINTITTTLPPITNAINSNNSMSNINSRPNITLSNCSNNNSNWNSSTDLENFHVSSLNPNNMNYYNKFSESSTMNYNILNATSTNYNYYQPSFRNLPVY